MNHGRSSDGEFRIGFLLCSSSTAISYSYMLVMDRAQRFGWIGCAAEMRPRAEEGVRFPVFGGDGMDVEAPKRWTSEGKFRCSLWTRCTHARPLPGSALVHRAPQPLLFLFAPFPPLFLGRGRFFFFDHPIAMAAQQPVLKYKTVVLKVMIHCEGCQKKVKKVLFKLDEVYRVDIDRTQDKVMVTGDVEADVLIRHLHKSGKVATEWPVDKKGAAAGNPASGGKGKGGSDGGKKAKADKTGAEEGEDADKGDAEKAAGGGKKGGGDDQGKAADGGKKGGGKKGGGDDEGKAAGGGKKGGDEETGDNAGGGKKWGQEDKGNAGGGGKKGGSRAEKKNNSAFDADDGESDDEEKKGDKKGPKADQGGGKGAGKGGGGGKGQSTFSAADGPEDEEQSNKKAGANKWNKKKNKPDNDDDEDAAGDSNPLPPMAAMHEYAHPYTVLAPSPYPNYYVAHPSTSISSNTPAAPFPLGYNYGYGHYPLEYYLDARPPPSSRGRDIFDDDYAPGCTVM